MARLSWRFGWAWQQFHIPCYTLSIGSFSSSRMFDEITYFPQPRPVRTGDSPTILATFFIKPHTFRFFYCIFFSALVFTTSGSFSPVKPVISPETKSGLPEWVNKLICPGIKEWSLDLKIHFNSYLCVYLCVKVCTSSDVFVSLTACKPVPPAKWLMGSWKRNNPMLMGSPNNFRKISFWFEQSSYEKSLWWRMKKNWIKRK